MSRTMEEHILKMIILFKRIRQNRIGRHVLGLSYFHCSETKDKMAYTEYLHQELRFSLRPYIPEASNSNVWYVDVPFRCHADERTCHESTVSMFTVFSVEKDESS